jgi:hypothetical protein
MRFNASRGTQNIFSTCFMNFYPHKNFLVRGIEIPRYKNIVPTGHFGFRSDSVFHSVTPQGVETPR